jgi:hypothetical protein
MPAKKVFHESVGIMYGTFMAPKWPSPFKGQKKSWATRKVLILCTGTILTINAPLILKMRDIIFFAAFGTI